MMWKIKQFGQRQRTEDFLSSLTIRLWNRKTRGFSYKSYLELFGAFEGEFFCLGGYVEKGFNLGSYSQEGFSLANRCYLCLSKEESIDHILLHCVLTRSLWNFLFSLFGVLWVLPYSIREALLGWLGPYVGKEMKKVWFSDSLCLFWIVWKERNNKAFENEGYSVQGCKLFFLCNVWAWTKGFFYSDPLLFFLSCILSVYR